MAEFGQHTLSSAPPPEQAAKRLYQIIGQCGQRLIYTVGADARVAAIAGALLPFHLFGKLARRLTGA